MSGATIIVIEDEPDILELIEYNLGREGFKTLASRDGEAGLKLAREQHPDLIILDLMLPGVSGLEICRTLKGDPETRTISIVILTAKSEESDIVLGLGLGADDYVTKPFSPKELIARVQAVLRRGPLKGEESARPRIELGAVVIDAARHQVLIEGAPVLFTATEFRLLHFLASNPGRVFTREQLINRAIGGDAFVIDRNIDVHIRSIRKKLAAHRDLVDTVRGVGYRFAEQP